MNVLTQLNLCCAASWLVVVNRDRNWRWIAVPTPDFETLMRPLLELASDGEEYSLRDARFNLTDDEKKTLLPSGRQTVFSNRVACAKLYLQTAGILNATQRGHFKISDRGKCSRARQNGSRLLLTEVPRICRIPITREHRQCKRRRGRPYWQWYWISGIPVASRRIKLRQWNN